MRAFLAFGDAAGAVSVCRLPAALADCQATQGGQGGGGGGGGGGVSGEAAVLRRLVRALGDSDGGGGGGSGSGSDDEDDEDGMGSKGRAIAD
jgi:hypothetical protein